MSNEAQKDVNPQANPAPEAPLPTVTVEQLKQKIEHTFALAWQDFIARIKHLPGLKVLLDRAMGHFDDGFLNFREGIRCLEVNPPVQPAQPAQPAQPQVQPPTPPEAPKAA